MELLIGSYDHGTKAPNRRLSTEAARKSAPATGNVKQAGKSGASWNFILRMCNLPFRTTPFDEGRVVNGSSSFYNRFPVFFNSIVHEDEARDRARVRELQQGESDDDEPLSLKVKRIRKARRIVT